MLLGLGNTRSIFMLGNATARLIAVSQQALIGRLTSVAFLITKANVHIAGGLHRITQRIDALFYTQRIFQRDQSNRIGL